MRIVPLTSVEVRKRQRSGIAPVPLNELMESILGRGLLHPPVCWFDPETKTWVLTVGERRFRAIQRINDMKPTPTFNCGETSVQPGTIPITPLGDYLDVVGRFEAELDENLQRSDLDWKDKAQALSDLHEMRLSVNPTQTLRDTGRELADKGFVRTAATGPESGASGAVQVRQAQIITQHLSDPRIAGARNANEAITLIYKAEEERITSALIRRQLRDAVNDTAPQLEVRQGDLLDVLPKLDAGTFDLIIADPPYGIGADVGGFRTRTVLHHNYADTPDIAKSLAQSILTEGFRLTRARANCFIFCDIDLFDWLKRTAANMGWTPFRRPFIWMKSESEGLAPWGAQGPRITTEFIFYATKGQRGLNASPVDVISVRRVPRIERIHAAEKPVELLRRLIECSTLPGDSVLDPCCGSGSTLVACRELKRRGLGIEKDPVYFNTAVTNVHSDTTGTEGTAHG